MTVILGLTGGIATGKSTASNFFKKKGIPVVDADIGARIVLEPGHAAYNKVCQLFGEGILNKDGTIDRKKLASIVFNDKNKLDQLNTIVQTDIYNWIQEQKNKHINLGHPIVVLDIPLLYEAGYDSEVDEIMVIATTETIQLQRLMNRDRLSHADALSRIKAQEPIQSKEARADVVIDNNGSITDTIEQLEAWLSHKGY